MSQDPNSINGQPIAFPQILVQDSNQAPNSKEPCDSLPRQPQEYQQIDLHSTQPERILCAKVLSLIFLIILIGFNIGLVTTAFNASYVNGIVISIIVLVLIIFPFTSLWTSYSIWTWLRYLLIIVVLLKSILEAILLILFPPKEYIDYKKECPIDYYADSLADDYYNVNSGYCFDGYSAWDSFYILLWFIIFIDYIAFFPTIFCTYRYVNDQPPSSSGPPKSLLPIPMGTPVLISDMPVASNVKPPIELKQLSCNSKA